MLKTKMIHIVWDKQNMVFAGNMKVFFFEDPDLYINTWVRAVTYNAY